MATGGDIVVVFTAAVDAELTVREFCEQSGLSPSTVRRLEDRTGLKLKRVRSYLPSHGKKTDFDWPVVLASARDRGLSVNRLADELFVTTGAVISAEDRTGIYLPRKRLNPKRVGGFRCE